MNVMNRKYFTGFSLIALAIFIFVMANEIDDTVMKLFAGIFFGYGISCLQEARQLEKRK